MSSRTGAAEPGSPGKAAPLPQRKRSNLPARGSAGYHPRVSRVRWIFICLCAVLVYGPGNIAAQQSAPVPISRVLADADEDRVPDRLGDRVVVEGIVTYEPKEAGGSAAIATIQDAGGGIVLFTREPARLLGRVARGDRVRAYGTVKQYYGVEEIVVDSVVRVGTGVVPEPQDAFAADLKGERLSGRLVRVDGELSVGADSTDGRELVLRDRSGEIKVRLPRHLRDDPVFIREVLESRSAEVVGIASQFTRETDLRGGYQLVPRDAQDFRLVRSPPYGLIAASAAFGALVLAALWLWIRRRRAESRVRETAALNARLALSRESLRQIIDALPHHIFVKDGEGRILIANAALARTYGVTVEALEGKHDATVSPVPAEAEQGRADDLDVIRTGEPKLIPANPVTTAAGERRLIETLKVPYRMSGSDGVGVLCIGRDVTEERETAEQLRRAERLASMGTLVSGVAHELNNPLSAIKGMSQLMLMDPRSGEDVEALETIHREADRMAQIVADLRRVARQTLEAEDTARALVDLNDVVRHVLRVRGYSLHTRNVSVIEDLQPDLEPVLANRGRIEQVILNLVVNAEQALGAITEDGSITIRTRMERRGVCLSVEDTGPGIAPENREHVFDPFWTTRAPGEGMGLGLSIVHGVVADHGGEIRVESELGKGARFVVMLPRAKDAAPAPVTARADAAPDAGGALRVLVVDDEAPVRQILVRYLKRRGHQVDEAEEGGAALRRIEAARNGSAYDAVVSDLRMPGMGGLELLERLRAQGEGMDRRLVFVTGDAASVDAERQLAAAGVPVLMKPFSFEQIDALIERVAST